MTPATDTNLPATVADETAADANITQKISADEATAMLTRMRTISKKVKGEMGEWYLHYRRLHDLGGYHALGYPNWYRFVEGELGISQTKAYRLLDLASMLSELQEAGVLSAGDVSDELLSFRQAAILKADPDSTGEISRSVGRGVPVAEAVGRAVEKRRASPQPAKAPRQRLRTAEKDAPVEARSREVHRRPAELFVPSPEQAAMLDRLRVLRGDQARLEAELDRVLDERLAVARSLLAMAVPTSLIAAAAEVTESRVRQWRSD